MKKISLLMLSIIFLFSIFSTGCNSKDTAEEPSRVIEISQCGLRYTLPDAWKPYETTNIVPLSSSTTEGDIYSQVQFNYGTDANMEKMNDFSQNESISDFLLPFGEIFVIHKSKLNSAEVIEAFSNYENQEEVTTQGDYHYFVCTDYKGDTSYLTEEEQKVYETLKESMKPLSKSISTFDFDEKVVADTINKIRRTITFVSHTLEGEEIGSTVFGDYDLTVVNFWGSYCYPDINETTTMEALKQKLTAEYPRVNLIQVVIDTPNAEAEKIALQAKQEGQGTFTSVMTDEVLANWIAQNLQGLPTTVFVDSNAEVVGEQIKGIHDLDFYFNEVENKLEELELSGK